MTTQSVGQTGAFQNIPIVQGDCFKAIIKFIDKVTGDPIDVSSWDFTGQIRKFYNSEEILATFTFTKDPNITNEVLVELTDSQTEALPVAEPKKAGQFNTNYLTYDIKYTRIDGCTYTLERGAIGVIPSVTKP